MRKDIPGHLEFSLCLTLQNCLSGLLWFSVWQFRKTDVARELINVSITGHISGCVVSYNGKLQLRLSKHQGKFEWEGTLLLIPSLIQTAIFSKQPRKTVLLTDAWHDALEFRGEQLSLLFSGAHYSSDDWYQIEFPCHKFIEIIIGKQSRLEFQHRAHVSMESFTCCQPNTDLCAVVSV